MNEQDKAALKIIRRTIRGAMLSAFVMLDTKPGKFQRAVIKEHARLEAEDLFDAIFGEDDPDDGETCSCPCDVPDNVSFFPGCAPTPDTLSFGGSATFHLHTVPLYGERDYPGDAAQ